MMLPFASAIKCKLMQEYDFCLKILRDLSTTVAMNNLASLLMLSVTT